MVRCTMSWPRLIPTHFLLPAPNGMYWKLLPTTFMLEFKNRSGMNSSGLSHSLGSRPMAQMFTKTEVLFGMS
ncbi:hypothetical protein Mapa_016721 [Marchantia paleacea]|nr:hypothetical protein Mapa_016721 [Marchantia paleacea]